MNELDSYFKKVKRSFNSLSILLLLFLGMAAFKSNRQLLRSNRDQKQVIMLPNNLEIYLLIGLSNMAGRASVFLSSMACDFVNGQMIYINGVILATIGKPSNEL